MTRLWVVFSVFLSGLMAGMPLAFAGDPNAKWPWRLQEPASLIKERMVNFHDHILFWMIVGIVTFVFILLVYVMVKYSARNNPVPNKFSHNVPLEIVWTVIPVLILIVIAVPSFKLLYYMDKAPGKPEVTVKAIGHQWYWEYQYPDYGDFSFNANMIPDKELKEGQPRLLATDNHVVIPVNTNVQFLVSAADVLHAFFIPAFGVNMLAIPGRTNEVWVNATKEGVYYGQCNKICGINHAYMPIAIEVVSKEAFAAWVEEAKVKFADTTAAPRLLAAQ
ncbi:MAG TPA: cytochrome c oxidase subunit II [Alphaproteobacteria bacterium]|nr:cytochrome c oxidase subunit II [Rhodospirillaceae bacterium]HRJ12566.1 cytochrome c oxidase subunit II [Alphaproteobacteria bacterium]